MTDTDDNSRQERVGFKRPPTHSRFKPGESGNRAGRPRGSRNVAIVLAEIINERAYVTENGRRRSMTKLEVAFRTLFKQAAGGNTRALAKLFDLARWLDGRSDAPSQREHAFNEADREVITAIYARLTALNHGETND